MDIDDENIVGPGVTGVEEYESGVEFEIKCDKTTSILVKIQRQTQANMETVGRYALRDEKS